MRLEVKGGVILIDQDDLDRLAGRSIYVGSNGYAYYSTWADGPLTIHGFVMGPTPRGKHIDHINGDKLDNRKSNLRVVTPQINQVNRKKLSKANKSGVRGVDRYSMTSKNPWRAQITVNHRNIYLGLYPTIEAATAARRAAEVEYFGEECPR